MSDSVQVKNDCLSLIEQADKATGDPAYWKGIRVAAQIILKAHAWHVLTSGEKRTLDPKRELQERAQRNSASKARRSATRAKTAHLHNYFTHHGQLPKAGESWERYGGSPECDSKRNLIYTEREEWPDHNRLVLDPSEATCHDCLERAIEKKIPGAEERQRKLWRDEEKQPVGAEGAGRSTP